MRGLCAHPYYTLSPTYSICREHGYIAGEESICPHCGAPTEVYSRITGYYRPVQNWNDGKLQEYANRKEYDIVNSTLKKKPTINRLVEDEVEVKKETVDAVKYLFTTKTCPNCRMAKEYLKNEDYILVDAEEEVELAQQYKVMQAPTYIVVNEQGVHKYVNVSNIKKYTDGL